MRLPHHRSAQVKHTLSRDHMVLPATHEFVKNGMNHTFGIPAKAGPHYKPNQHVSRGRGE